MHARAHALLMGLITSLMIWVVFVFPNQASAAILVTSNANSGAGTLRQAITDANASSGPDVIEFAIGAGTTTISITSDLPTSTEELTINGWSQPGWSNFPLIGIRPSSGATRAIGCSAKCTIQGIGGYGSSAHFFQLDAGSDNSVFRGNWVGVNTTTAVFALSDGLYVNAPNVTIGGTGSFDRNVINGSTASITLTINASNASVIGNYIGTNVTGTIGSAGSLFINGADNVVIGGTTVSERNIFGSNSTMVVARYGADNLKIYGNYFGFRPDGTLRIPNTVRSITVASSTNIEIGTSTQATPQLLVSHIPAAITNIAVSTTQVDDFRMYNNYINLIASGLVTTGTGAGLQLGQSTNITIGGSNTNERNYFNVGGIEGMSIQNISIKNNYFGNDVLGTTALGAPRGITFTNVTSLYMGGDTDAERNIMLSTNAGNYGLSITNGDQLYIKNNYWGLNPSGIQTAFGIWQATNFTNVTNVQFGTPTSKQVFGPNGGGSIVITTATSVALYNNIVGSNVQQSASLSSAANTFRLTSVTSVTVGGVNPNEGNVFVSTNLSTFFDRVYDMTFYGNIYNLNASGSAQLGGGGIMIRDSRQLVFGGSDPGEGNVVLAASNGLFLDATAYIDRPLDAVIEGNTFGFNASGTRTFRSSTDSIFVDQGYTDVLIKNNSFGWANFANIELWRNRNVTIQGNYFGYTSSTSLFSGTRHGVYQWETTSTIIGGFTAGEGNYFGTSSQAMLDLERSTSTRVYGNFLGVTTSGRMLVGTSTQIEVGFNMYDLHIGGTTVGMGNYIANAANGIYHENSIDTFILGNVIGMSPSSTAGYGFTTDAIFIGTGSTNTRLGDGTLAGANSIGGGGFAGIETFRSTSTQVYGNFFGTNTTTATIAPNGRDIYLEQVYLTTIGGAVAGQGNVFANSAFDSIQVIENVDTTTIKGNAFGTDLAHTASLTLNTNAGTAAIYLGGTNSTGTIIGGLAAGEANWMMNGRSGIQLGGHLGSADIIGNIIVDNAERGFDLFSTNGPIRIWGNHVGVDDTDTIRPNGTGLYIDGNQGAIQFGGASASEQNRIIGNTSKGITLLPTASNVYLYQNIIHSNGGIQIDLGNDDATTNDLLDADIGANGLLNYPIPLGITGGFAGFAYSGLPSTNFDVDVYFASSTDSFGRGQMMVYGTTVNFTTDISGLYSGSVDVASVGYVDGDKVVFLAKTGSSTSELSGGLGSPLGIALTASSTDNLDNTSDVEFTYTLVNYGADTVTNIQLFADIAEFFNGLGGISIVSAPVSSQPSLDIDLAFDGQGDITMFNAGASSLLTNTTATITFIVNVPHSPTALYSGFTTTTGIYQAFNIEDVSASGTVPDVGNGVSYDGDLDPSNNKLITTLTLPTYTPPTPEVSFQLDAQTVSETAGTATVSIDLNAATSATDIVATYSVGGTASDPADFITPSGSFTILAGESATSIQVTLVNDLTIEGDKTIVLTLTGVTPNATTGATTTHTITLQSEDVPPPPTVEFTSSTDDIAEDGGTRDVQVELSSTIGTDVILGYTVGGTATSTDDYTALSGTVTIFAGNTTATIPVSVFDDGFYEGNEDLEITLQTITPNAASGTILLHTLTILENDIQPVVDFESVSTTGLEAALGTVSVPLVMSATSSLPVEVVYQITGTALDGTDYLTLSGTTTFAALSSSTVINVTVLDDATVESDDTIILDIITVDAHASLGATTTYMITITNDDTTPATPPTPTVTGAGGLPATTPIPAAAAPSSTGDQPRPTEPIVTPTDPTSPTSPNPSEPNMTPVKPVYDMCKQEVTGLCSPYINSYIKYGAKNSTEDVRKLQLFLRDTMGMKEVKVTGIYDLVSYRAVMKFQAGLQKDVLTPWSLAAPTGYVYITTSRAINRIHCQKNPPKPQVIDTCDTGCVKKIRNYEGKEIYLNVCNKALSCQPLLTKSLIYGSRANSAVEVERLQVVLNIALQRSRKPTRVFDQATRKDLEAVLKTYFSEEKPVVTGIGGKAGSVNEKLQTLLNGIWCEK